MNAPAPKFVETLARLGRSLVVALCVALAGCGTTRQNAATEQLLLSDAVDRSVARIDFSPLAGRKVYLDTQFVPAANQGGFANTPYIISSIRQQMVAARCLLQENRDAADLIAELRVGALGTDGHDMSYGIPASGALNSAISLVPNTPPMPAMPELSVAKRREDLGAAKIAVFAYDRKTKEARWQSGLSQAESASKDKWILGTGPYRTGSIYEGPRVAGRRTGGLRTNPKIWRLSDEDEAFRSAAVWPDRQVPRNSGQLDQQDAELEQLLADRKPPAPRPPSAPREKPPGELTSHTEPAPLDSPSDAQPLFQK